MTNNFKTSRQYELVEFNVGDFCNAKWGTEWLEADIVDERPDGLWQVQFRLDGEQKRNDVNC